jgi:hypothetical protein
MALILASHLSPLPVLEGYDDSVLGVLPEYRSTKSLSEQIIDTTVCKVERNNNEIKLTFNLSHLKSKTFTITSSLFKANTRFVGFFTQRGTFEIFELSDMLRDPVSFAKIKTLKNVTGQPFVHIYFHNSFTEGLVLVHGLPISNETFTIFDRNTYFTDPVITYFPSFATTRDNDEAKKKVLYDLNSIDSTVALEQQVDLLTTLVKNLINNQSQPSWSTDFLTKTEASSVTTLREVSSVISDLDTAKKKIRAAQKTYFDSLK